MTALDLGMPSAPRTTASPSQQPQVLVEDVPVGGGAPVSVQSMTTTLTADVDATLQQIAELTAAGCDIVRVAVPSQDDADALPAIARRSTIPVIADIHFQPRYVFAAIDAGCAAVRVNPGNIKKFDDKIREIAHAAEQARVPIRIGVNAGSLDPRLLTKHGKATPEALVESALWECSLFEEHDFTDLKISVKHHDPLVMIAAYRLLAARCDYPLIRVSLTAPPRRKVKVGTQILAPAKPEKPTSVSVPATAKDKSSSKDKSSKPSPNTRSSTPSSPKHSNSPHDTRREHEQRRDLDPDDRTDPGRRTTSMAHRRHRHHRSSTTSRNRPAPPRSRGDG